MKFMDYTQLNQDKTRYTEFMDKKIKSKVYKYIENYVQTHPSLKYEIKNR